MLKEMGGTRNKNVKSQRRRAEMTSNARKDARKRHAPKREKKVGRKNFLARIEKP